jgi:hypothetical protein
MLIAGIAPDGGVIHIVAEPPKAAPVTGVKVAVADVSTGPQGKLTVAFSTLDAVDSDGDVTVHGAFTPTEVPLSQWGHASWQPGFLPIGRGTIREEGNRGVFRGQMFLGTQAGAETFEVLKALGPLSEFSYGYAVAEADRGMFEGRMVRFLRKLVVHEVSPVLKGAGVRTGVLEMSSLDPWQIEVARIARENERELGKLRGYAAGSRKLLGYAPNGAPVFAASAGGRK